MRYIRKINGYVEESPIPPYRGAEYYAAHGYLRSDSTLPLSRLDIVDGEIVELPAPEPTEEWVGKEAFINALYALLPADQLAAALQKAETFKQGIAGLALLTSDAAPGGQINFSPLVENYPGLPGVSGLQLSEALTRQAEEQGVELDYAQVLGFRPEEGGFAVETDGGPLHCRALILAPGTRHRPLGLEGEEALTGQGVSYCAVCDGPFYQGRDTAIVGGGDTALQEALFLSGVCRRVTLIHRRLEFRGIPKLAERVRTRDNIRLLLGYTPQALLQAEGRLTGLRVRQASTGQTLELPLDGVFAAVGRVPGTAPFRAQLELDEEGYFRSGEDCRTRLPGVFVAGDCRAKEVRQLATAVGDGAVAGLAAARFVEDGQG